MERDFAVWREFDAVFLGRLLKGSYSNWVVLLPLGVLTVTKPPALPEQKAVAATELYGFGRRKTAPSEFLDSAAAASPACCCLLSALCRTRRRTL